MKSEQHIATVFDSSAPVATDGWAPLIWPNEGVNERVLPCNSSEHGCRAAMTAGVVWGKSTIEHFVIMSKGGSVTKEEREVRHYRKYLTNLTLSVRHFLYLLDEEMKNSSSVDRGKRIAALANDLNLKNDEARYFGLRIDYRKDKPLKMKGKSERDTP